MLHVFVLYLMLYILLVVAWLDSEKDILSPSVLVCASFIVGVTFYMVGYNRLAEENFSLKTILLILGGLTVFLLVGSLARRITRYTLKLNRGNRYKCLNYSPVKAFNVPSYFYIGFVLLVTITTIAQIMNVRKQMEGNSIIAMLQQFRNTINSGGNESLSNSGFVKLFSRVINALQPCLIFSMLYNRIVSKKKAKRPVLMWIGIGYSILCMFAISFSRATVFTIAFETMCAVAICTNIRNSNRAINKTTKGNRAWIKIAFLVLLVGIPSFYLGGVIAGKSYSQIRAIQSVENYFSYGLIRLNHIVNNGFAKSEHFGQWSFSGIYAFLNRMGGNYKDYNIFPFYLRYGNTITVFGRWYVDFGFFGALFMAAIVSAFVWYIYTRMKFEYRKKRAIFYIVMYIYTISNILMVVYDDWFRNIITINYAVRLIVIIFTCRWLNRILKSAH